MADPIKASIEVEIDPTPDEIGCYRVTWPGGWYMRYSAADLTRRGLPVPSPPWSLGWVDADGNPVLDDLSREDVSGFLNYLERLTDLGEFDSWRESAEALARALRKQLEADDG